jgi:hypothetical protein
MTNDCTKLLLEAGQNPNERHALPENETYEPLVLYNSLHQVNYSPAVSPLSLISMFDNGVCHAEALIEAGAHLDARSPHEVPTLLPAIEKYNLKLTRLLIRKGANVNIYHPQLFANMAIVVCLHNWRSFNFILWCGAEAESLFVDPLKEEDNDEGVARIPFWKVLMEARGEMSRMSISVTQVLMRLMHYVGNVVLHPQLKSLVDKEEDWKQIAETQGETFTYCRHAHNSPTYS